MNGHDEHGPVLQMLLCPPDTATPPTGARQRPCAYCGRGLWVEPAVIGHTDAGDVLPMCAACVALELGVSRGVRLGVLPGQEETFARFGISARAGVDIARLDSRSDSYRRLLDAIDHLRRDDEKREEP